MWTRQTVVAEKQHGVVAKEAAGGKAGAAGLIRFVEGDAAAVLLPFAASDVEAAGGGSKVAVAAGKGDPVEFTLVSDRATGERWAVKVAAVPHEGVVDSVKDTYGYIRPDRPEDAGGGGGSGGGAHRLVVFYLNEVGGAARGAVRG